MIRSFLRHIHVNGKTPKAIAQKATPLNTQSTTSPRSSVVIVNRKPMNMVMKSAQKIVPISNAAQ